MNAKPAADLSLSENILRSQTVLGAVMAALLMVAVGVIFYINIYKYTESTRIRQESYLTQIYLQKYFSDLRDAETGQRGFLLTEERSYLAPFETALERMDDDWAELIRHQPTGGAKQLRLAELKRLSGRKIDELKKSLAIYRTKGHLAAIAQVSSGQGKRDMDQIRVLVNEISTQEEKQILASNEGLRTHTRNTILFSAIIGILGLFIFIFIIVLLVRESNTRLRLNDRLEIEVEEKKRANALLEQQAEERERAKSQIDELNRTLEGKVNNLNAVNKELEAFSYSVSHDLRAPLRSIDGFSQALLNKYADNLDANGKDYLNRVRANTQRMAQLIDDMLQLSRLTRGDLNLTEVNLSELATGIIEESRQQDPERKANIQIQPDLVVQGDKRLLQAVLQNLLNNAWKFTSQHEEANIKLGSFLKDGQPVYFVKDDGAGFEMDYVDKLFGAFQRLHAMNEFPGTGVGLATVQRIIHRHGGQTWAEGEPEKGATLYFTLNTNLID